jgi:ribosome-associated toxin RatA of RatAB toxin-antitoxin module
MPVVTVTRELNIEPERLFLAVRNLESYHKFVPTVVDATVMSQSVPVPVSVSVATRYYTGKLQGMIIEERLSEKLVVEFTKVPFKNARADISMRPLGERGCHLTCEFTYEFVLPIFQSLFNKYYENIVDRLCLIYVQRARQLQLAA